MYNKGGALCGAILTGVICCSSIVCLVSAFVWFSFLNNSYDLGVCKTRDHMLFVYDLVTEQADRTTFTPVFEVDFSFPLGETLLSLSAVVLERGNEAMYLSEREAEAYFYEYPENITISCAMPYKNGGPQSYPPPNATDPDTFNFVLIGKDISDQLSSARRQQKKYLRELQYLFQKVFVPLQC